MLEMIAAIIVAFVVGSLGVAIAMTEIRAMRRRREAAKPTPESTAEAIDRLERELEVGRYSPEAKAAEREQLAEETRRLAYDVDSRYIDGVPRVRLEATRRPLGLHRTYIDNDGNVTEIRSWGA